MALRYLERQSFDPHEVIIRQGDEGHVAYIVETGLVQILIDSAQGRRELGRVGPGGIFGEMVLIHPGLRSATVIALEPTTCYVIFEAELRAKIDPVDPLVKALLRILVRNVRETDMAVSLVDEH